MPHPITGDSRRDEDAAERAYLNSVRAAYRRLHEIELAIRDLGAEKAAINKKILDDIGIAPGDILDTRLGKVKVISARGAFQEDFLATPVGAPYRVWPAVACTVAPATKAGFHATTRKSHIHIDRETSFMAQGGLPVEE